MIGNIFQNIRAFFVRNDMDAARKLYSAAVEQARDPQFYLELSVQDTVDGRFDMITIHVMLLLDRLRGQGKRAAEVGQQVFDTMFDDMDRSLREMGVGDLSVGKKVRTMASAFYGRAAAYQGAMDDGDQDGLVEALKRNLFAEQAVPQAHIERLARYMVANRRHLQDQGIDRIVDGQVAYVALGAVESAAADLKLVDVETVPDSAGERPSNG